MLSALCALLLSAPVSALPQPVVGEGWGVNLGFNDLAPKEVELLGRGGFRWVRRDLFWHEVETVKGQYRWDRWDRLLAQLEPQGIRPMFILCYGNGLYQEGAPTTDAARAAFVRYAVASVEHFKGRGVVWEMWNEPNNHHWQPRPNVEDYVRLALEVGKALHERFPEETLVMPAVAGYDWTFLRRCLDAGLLLYYDALTVHPYRPMEPESAFADTARLRAMLKRYAPDREVPILSGEWGYSAATGVMDEDRQGAYFVRQYLANLAAGVPMSIWYNWTNNGTRPAEILDNFGVLRQDLSPKRAYDEARRLRGALEGYRFDKRLAMSDGRDWVLLFRNGAAVGVAGWTTEPGGSKRRAPAALGGFALGPFPAYRTFAKPTGWVRQASEWAAVPPSATLGTADDAWEVVRPLWQTLPKGARLQLVDGGRPFRTWAAGTEAARVRADLASLPRLIDRSEAPRPLRFRALLAGEPPIEQEMLASHPSPLRVAVTPEAQGVRVTAESLTGGLRGTVRVVVPGEVGLREAVRLGDAEVKELAFPTVRVGPRGVRAELLDARGRTVASTPTLRFGPLSLEGLTTSLSGDAKVAGEVRVSAAGAARVAVDYRFAEGWRYSEIALARPAPLDRTAARLGMWVNGDGSGTELRMRYVDSTGQVFQPDAGPIDWRGWRFVTFSLRGDAAGRWGGMNDGIVYWPIRIQTLVLLDNPGGRGAAGRIEIRDAAVQFETP